MANRGSCSNLKSNVYQPVAASLFQQLMAEQHMNNHYRLIDDAKSSVDNKTPKCFQNEIKKRKSTSSVKSSRPSSRLSQLSFNDSYGDSINSFKDENVLRNALHLKNKKVKDPLQGLKTSDKVALYIDIMQEKSDKLISSYDQRNKMNNRKNVDFMDSDAFTKPNKPFTPKIIANNSINSKISQLRCYNPPIKQKTITTKKFSHLEHNKRVPANSKIYHEKWLNEQAKKAEARQRAFPQRLEPTPDSAYNDSLISGSHADEGSIKSWEKSNQSKSTWSNKDEELQYLQFVSEVTEDILSRGIFTNRVLKSVLKSHMQKRSTDLSITKMSILLDQLREDLGIPTSDKMDDINAGLGSSKANVLDEPTGVLDFFSNDEINNESYSHKDYGTSQPFSIHENSESISLNLKHQKTSHAFNIKSEKNSEINRTQYQPSSSNNSSKIIESVNDISRSSSSDSYNVNKTPSNKSSSSQSHPTSVRIKSESNELESQVQSLELEDNSDNTSNCSYDSNDFDEVLSINDQF